MKDGNLRRSSQRLSEVKPSLKMAKAEAYEISPEQFCRLDPMNTGPMHYQLTKRALKTADLACLVKFVAVEPYPDLMKIWEKIQKTKV